MLGLIVCACETPAGDGSSTVTTAAADLSCVDRVWIHRDPDGGFEGYATELEALEAWDLGGPGEPPNGRWEHLEGSRWILIDAEGKTVALAEVSEWTSNSVTTFATVRYASFNIEYCDS